MLCQRLLRRHLPREARCAPDHDWTGRTSLVPARGGHKG